MRSRMPGNSTASALRVADCSAPGLAQDARPLLPFIRLKPPPVGFRQAVDLTHTMSPDFPTFFGESGIEMEKKFDFHKGWIQSVLVANYRACRNASRCSDTFSENGMTAEAIPIMHSWCRLRWSMSRQRRRRTPITRIARRSCRLGEQTWPIARKLLRGHAFRMGRASGRRDESSPVRTVPVCSHFPGFGIDAAEWLMKERKVIGLAVDTLSLDHGPSKDSRCIIHGCLQGDGDWRM